MEPSDVVRRGSAAGLHAGARLTRISPPVRALALVAPQLGAAEVRLQELVGSHVDVVTAIGRYLTAAGGKRLRPMLVALGAGAVGHDHDLDRLMCVGELIHLGSLLHDDVVDEGLTRRNRPAAWCVYGNAAVILTGDFCLARAVLLASESGGHAAVTALAAAVTAMAEGEVLQLQRAGNLRTSRAEYLEMIDKKSAALIAWCAAAGPLAAQQPALASALHAYGREIGIAFQITDDVIDYLPETGKNPGADLRERKLTLPLVHAMERIPGLQARLEARPPTPEELPELIGMITASGALDAALDEARARVQAATSALAVLPDTPYRGALEEMGHYLVERVV